MELYQQGFDSLGFDHRVIQVERMIACLKSRGPDA